MRLLIITMLTTLLFSTTCAAWEGYDWDSGDSFEIESGNTVRAGNDIELYHWDDGQYHNATVEYVSSYEVEVYDWDSGEYRTLEMN